MALRELFLKALALQGAERDDFLNQHCQTDPALRRELNGLLTAANGANDYCQNLAARIGARENQPVAQSMPERVGAYRPLELIGQGGMGSVYLAERIDQHFEKQVAIKVLPASVDAETADRFVNERQILARLVHPNIARLLDGGLTDDQRPYFVMDYVDGEPIDAFCDRNQFTTDQRLKLFFQVCTAVQFAHTNLVLHRDLKPSNIFVNNSEMVQLLDFGVSEMLSGDSVTFGDQARSPLTPAYASPEMIRGQSATTASDVYSLGVLLFRLVTGLHPFAVEDDDLSDLLGKVLEQDTPRASERWRQESLAPSSTCQNKAENRRVSTKGLLRQLTPDLDAVLMTALARTPKDRYQTATELADDIDALRSQRPVRVIDATPGYRLRRFCQRYPFSVALTAISLTLLIALSVLATRFAIQTQRQADIVAAERDRSDSVSNFLLSLFVQANPRHNPKGTSITARELLDIGVDRIHQLRAQPDTQAALLSLAANAYSHMDLLEQAKPLFVDALAIHRDEPATPLPVLSITLTRLARVESELGNWASAESYAQESLALLRDSDRLGPSGIPVARSLLLLGIMRLTQGDYPASERYLDEALQTAKLTAGPYGEVLIARILSHQGTVALEKGQPAEAIRLHRRALSIRRRLAKRPTIDQADSLLRLGQAQHALGKLGAAERSVLATDAIHQRLLEANSAANAMTARTLGEIKISQGNLPAGEEQLNKAIAIWRRISTRQQPELALCLSSLAELRLLQSEPELAQALFEESLAISERMHPTHWRTAQTRDKLSVINR